MTTYTLAPIGQVKSSLSSRKDAPRQGDEGAPEADIVFNDSVAAGLADITPGDELIILTWLHEADRTVLVVHPRGDLHRSATGVFCTRSPDRPNPVGLHRITVLAVDGLRLRVSGIEAIDGTPVIDLKPVLGSIDDR